MLYFETNAVYPIMLAKYLPLLFQNIVKLYESQRQNKTEPRILSILNAFYFKGLTF